MRCDPASLRFVEVLLAGGVADRDGAVFRVAAKGRRAELPVAMVERLVSDGVIAGGGAHCMAGAQSASWLRRQRLKRMAPAENPHAAQHRVDRLDRDGVRHNLAESPLARLALGSGEGGSPFLAPHQIEAGERFRRLAERAQLRPRTTMSYSPAHTASGRDGRAPEPADMAIDARRALAEIQAALPHDCAGVVMDVCGMEKGLQQIESERGWPRRSAKLVLRIALETLAGQWGLTATARGGDSRRPHRWMAGDRPDMFET
ncbi:DUF6456 domain-containing protein [Devosia sp.]|uniref:DUF6456 domain-containing protein n=1 Tax=Devosia sp. TaxID=1871048 RepID=UPI003A90A7F9